jgi:FkbM family methyltransferase
MKTWKNLFSPGYRTNLQTNAQTNPQAYVIVSLRIRRGTIKLDSRFFPLVKPYFDSSFRYDEAVAHIQKELRVPRQAAIDHLHWLHYNGLISFSSMPVSYFEHQGVQLFVRAEGSYGDVDRSVVQEVQRSYYFEKINIQEATTVIDIGGHIGSFSAYIKSLNPRLTIVAVEAEANNAEMMRLNLGDLPSVFPFRGLLTYSNDPVKLVRHKENSGGHLSTAFWPSGWSPEIFEEVQSVVPPITLEQLMDYFSIRTISLLKVDCEGCEFDLFGHVSTRALDQVERIVGEYHETLDGFRRRLEPCLTGCFKVIDAQSHQHTSTSGKFYAMNKRLG